MPKTTAENLSDNKVRLFKYAATGSKIQRKWDAQVVGLGIEVFASGNKSWIFRYRFAGKQKFKTIGSAIDFDVHQAREKALAFRSTLTKGINPTTLKDTGNAAEMTLQQAFDKYIDDPVFKSKSPDFQNNFPSGMKKHVLPVLGDHQVRHIIRTQLKAIYDDLFKSGKTGAAKAVVTHSKILFNYCIDTLDIIENSPADRLKVIATKTTRKDLTIDQMKTLWYFNGKPQIRALLRWLLLTGCRRDEARTMTWDQIKDGIWTRPDTKNDRDLVLPITPAMQAILDDMKSTYDSEFVFPSTTSMKKPVPRGSLHHLVKDLDFVIHETRHTTETVLKNLGVDKERRDLVLNHVSQGSGSHYDHSPALVMKQSALDIWHDYINSHVV